MKKFLAMVLSSSMICSTLAFGASGLTVTIEGASNLKQRSSQISTVNGISTITITETDSSGTTTKTFRFEDVHKNAWYHSFITDMTADGYVTGKTSTSFDPEAGLSVAEFSVMVANAFYGKNLATELSKSYSNWWTPYIEAVDARGGLSGTTAGQYYDTTGSWGTQPYNDITRYDMATMIFNVMKEQGVTLLSAAKVQEIISTLPDTIDSAYRDAVAHAYYYTFLTGRVGGIFDGNNTLNRSEAAVVLSALVNSDIITAESLWKYGDTTGSNTTPGEVPQVDKVPDTEVPQVDKVPDEEEVPQVDKVPDEEEVPQVDKVPDEEEVPQVDKVPDEEEVTYYSLSATSSHGSLQFTVNGSATSNSRAEAGDKIVVNIDVEEGYELSALTMNNLPLTVSNNSASFTMPESEAVLLATYVETETLGTKLASVTTSSGQSNTLSKSRWASAELQDIFVVGNDYITMDATSGNVVLTVYDSNNTQQSTHTLKNPLTIFGGFTYGSDGNYYAVYGQKNEEESSSKEVFRVVKYNQNFQEVSSYSVKGSDSLTTVPFDASSTALMEENGVLVVHSSRERFASSDGLNHQSQFTIVLDSSSMTLKNTLGEFQKNHVSHSFNQMVGFDGSKILLVDHGDAYPRSVVLHHSSDGGKTYTEVDLLKIPGSIGANCTGLTLGGFAVGSSSYLTVVNRVDWDSVTSYTSFAMTGLTIEERDIVLLVTNPSSFSTKEVTLANYVGTGKSGSTPEIVEISSNKFMVLWEEFDATTSKSSGVYYALLDGSGNITQSKTLYHSDATLSRYGSPVYFGGEVIWFVDANGSRTLYHIAP